MFKRILPLILSLSLLVSCGSTQSATTQTTAPESTAAETTQIVATTYPVYLLASALTAGIEEISVSRLNTGEVSCLHDYTLSVSDMKLIEGAHFLAMNGGELEDFMGDALAQTSAIPLYCDYNIDYLYMDAHDHDHDHEEETTSVDDHDHDHDHEEETTSVDDHDHDHDHEEETTSVDDHDHDHDHEEETTSVDDHDHDHDHEEETTSVDDHDHDHEDEEELVVDPHFWMDPSLYVQMMSTLATQLSEALPAHQAAISANCEAATQLLLEDSYGAETMSTLSSLDFITFHDGFHYFSHAFGLNPLASIEEEAGSEASAQEIAEIIGYVKDYAIPAIFTEVNGSDSTALTISRETGCQVYTLNMLMSGDAIADGLTAQEILSTYYVLPMQSNIETIKEAMK